MSRKLFCLSLLLIQSEPGESPFQKEVHALFPLLVLHSCALPISRLRPRDSSQGGSLQDPARPLHCPVTRGWRALRAISTLPVPPLPPPGMRCMCVPGPPCCPRVTSRLGMSAGLGRGLALPSIQIYHLSLVGPSALRLGFYLSCLGFLDNFTFLQILVSHTDSNYTDCLLCY